MRCPTLTPRPRLEVDLSEPPPEPSEVSPTGTEEDAEPEGRPRGRIAAIDVARALAILGMLAVHVGPTDAEGLGGRLYSIPHGRASILFVFIAGIGTALLAGSPNLTRSGTRLTLLWRALLLLPLGLALQELDHGAAVILQDYAIFFILAIVVIGWSDRWLLALAGASAVLGPLVFLWGQNTAPHVYDRAVTAITDPVGSIVHGLILSGPYPLITWMAPFLVGLWIGRRDLRSPWLHRQLAVGGAAGTALTVGLAVLLRTVFGSPSDVGGLYELLSMTPHSQMLLWLVGGTAASAMTLGVCLLVVHRAERLFWPLTASGQLALTVYVGHLIMLHLAPETLTSDELSTAVIILTGFTAAILILCAAWRTWFARGPLEAGLRIPWEAIERIGPSP